MYFTKNKHNMIKFVSDLRQVGFSTGIPVSSTKNNDHHDITEILLKVCLNTITIPPPLRTKKNHFLY